MSYLKKESTDNDGEIVITYEEYNDLNNLTNRYSKKRNLLHGSFEIYRRNGNKFLKTNYINGRIDGEYKEWYDNNQIYIDCYIKDDDILKYKIYDYDGNILHKSLDEKMFAIYELFNF
jgi:antitoxin component YwqK of YwqJK toxin-antitoxin module